MTLLYLESLPPRTTKGQLLQFLLATGAVNRDQVGRIEVRGSTALIEVPDGSGPRLVKALDGASLQDRRVHAWFAVDAGRAGAGSDHFRRLAELLELEAKAEAREKLDKVRRLTAADAERNEDCLVGLIVTEESSGLGGRCLLTLARRNRTLPLPWNRLEPGTPVLLSVMDDRHGDGWPGVVSDREEKTLTVALNEPPDETESGTVYRIDVSSNEAARQRQLAALERARSAQRERLADLRAVLLGDSQPTFQPELPFTPFDAALNDSQQAAVRFALSANDLAILHGPPGTGKTTAVVELIRQAVARGDKVLACAPSNLAVDNMLERLLAWGERAVRLGHPARVLSALRAHTLDLMVEEHEDRKLAKKLAREAFALFRKAGKYTRARPEPGARQDMRQEARAMLADARRLEAMAIEHILDKATVLCATLTGLDSEVLGRRQFDLAVIDEASQSTEPACWLPLLRSRRVVLAGDHCQLPPTVVSQEAARQGFAVSMMERLADLSYGPTVLRRLDVQYRMHEAIMTYPSLQFYDGRLEAHASVRGHLLHELPGVAAVPLTQEPVHFIDTAGAGYDEQPDPAGDSRLNPQEAELIRRKVLALLEAGVAPEAIAVIAPYSAQVRLLRDKVKVAGLEIDSIDGFQGREKEAIVLSLVRSNQEGEVGFLADIRRMNVALTRARRKLIVVGDSATLSSHPFYRELFAYFESIGAHHSVWEEPDV